MYIETAEDPTPIRAPRLTVGILLVLFAGIVLLGVYPAPLMDVIQSVSDVVLSSEGVQQLVLALD